MKRALFVSENNIALIIVNFITKLSQILFMMYERDELLAIREN